MFFPLRDSSLSFKRSTDVGLFIEGPYFHQLGPLGRDGLVVAMCVCLCDCLFVCLMSPFHVFFSRGWTGAERASSVDWCDLDLDLDLD